jgi:hypothetical protein
MRALLLEKVPLLAVSAASAAVAVIAQRASSSIAPSGAVPLSLRLANAVVSYVVYIRKMFWPGDLVVFYPYPLYSLRWWQVAGSAALLVAITVLVLRARSRRYLLVGWLWYLVTLLPVIGIVQVGGQAMADRYTYLPLIGLFIMVAWGISDLIPGRRGIAVLTAAAVLAMLPLVLVTRAQVGYWKDDITLFTRAAKLTRDNWAAQHMLGVNLFLEGRAAEALPHAREAVRIQPYNPVSHVSLGVVLANLNMLGEAADEFDEAIRIDPESAFAHANLARTLLLQGDKHGAREHAQIALSIQPDNTVAQNVLSKTGK